LPRTVCTSSASLLGWPLELSPPIFFPFPFDPLATGGLRRRPSRPVASDALGLGVALLALLRSGNCALLLLLRSLRRFGVGLPLLRWPWNHGVSSMLLLLLLLRSPRRLRVGLPSLRSYSLHFAECPLLRLQCPQQYSLNTLDDHCLLHLTQVIQTSVGSRTKLVISLAGEGCAVGHSPAIVARYVQSLAPRAEGRSLAWIPLLRWDAKLGEAVTQWHQTLAEVACAQPAVHARPAQRLCSS
jgi:hypothetical protein